MLIVIVFDRDGEFESHEFDYEDTLETVYSKVAKGEGLEEEILSFDDEILPRDDTQLQETTIVSESIVTISKKYTEREIIAYNEKYIEIFRGGRRFSLEDVPFQTPEVCLAAVRAHGMNLEYVKHQTPELCLEAVRNCPSIFDECEFQNHEICEAAIRGDSTNFEIVEDKTERLCEIALDVNVHLFTEILNPSERLCELAVSKDGYMLEYVKNQTQRICDLATDEEPRAFKYVEDRFKHREMYIKVLERKGMLLKYVLTQTPDLCWLALKQDPHAIEYIHSSTEEMWIYTVTKGPDIFKWDETPKTRKVCLAAVKRYSMNIKYIPYQTNEMRDLAYRDLGLRVFNYLQNPTDSMCWKYIESRRSNRIFEYSWQQHKINGRWIECYEPCYRYQNDEFIRGDPGFDDKEERYDINYEHSRVIELLVERNPERIRDLHWFNQTERMCLKVLNRRPDLVEYIKISTDKIYNLLEDARERLESRSVETFKRRKR